MVGTPVTIFDTGDGKPIYKWGAISGKSGETALAGTQLGGQNMTTKDKNTKKSMEKKPAQKTLKEKRQAKKAKK